MAFATGGGRKDGQTRHRRLAVTDRAPPIDMTREASRSTSTTCPATTLRPGRPRPTRDLLSRSSPPRASAPFPVLARPGPAPGCSAVAGESMQAPPPPSGASARPTRARAPDPRSSVSVGCTVRACLLAPTCPTSPRAGLCPARLCKRAHRAALRAVAASGTVSASRPAGLESAASSSTRPRRRSSPVHCPARSIACHVSAIMAENTNLKQRRVRSFVTRLLLGAVQGAVPSHGTGSARPCGGAVSARLAGRAVSARAGRPRARGAPRAAPAAASRLSERTDRPAPPAAAGRVPGAGARRAEGRAPACEQQVGVRVQHRGAPGARSRARLQPSARARAPVVPSLDNLLGSAG